MRSGEGSESWEEVILPDFDLFTSQSREIQLSFERFKVISTVEKRI